MAGQSSEEIILCPTCLVAVDETRVCPRCGGKLDKGDWPLLKAGEEQFVPWADTNLRPPREGEEGYQLLPLTETVEDGELLTKFPYLFKDGKHVIRMGASLGADVRIRGASSLHAFLLQNKRTKVWWVYDCGSESGTFVNGRCVHVCALQVDDVIGIAGVQIAFRGNRLETGRSSAAGMSLSVEDLCFSIGERAILDHVTFRVEPGEFIGVLGPSGCGKSSLVQRLIGLAKPDEGGIYANGYLIDEVADEFRAATAYLPQNVEKTLHDNLTLEEEIDCFRRLHLPPSENEEQENVDCLKTLGLSGLEHSRIRNLSGGEKRRVGIALALLRRPQLLMLDEPGAGLDPAAEGVLMQHLRGIANQGRTVLCVTHVLTNQDKFDKLLVLSRGKIVYFGKPAAVLETFAAPDWGSFYRQLGVGVASKYTPDRNEDLTKFEFQSVGYPTFLRRVGGYLKRMAESLFSGKFWDLLFSSPGSLFLWQPLGLVIGIRLACAGNFRNGGDFTLLGFCAALAMFWVGINNAARSLVAERVPGRCLENLNQVSCESYLVSKIVWTLFICAVQTLSFVFLLWIAARVSIPLVEKCLSNETRSIPLRMMWIIPLYASCLMGAFCGLSVSAITKKVMSAISVVPNVAILALLFSNAMIQFEDSEMYVWIAKWIAWCMPCHWASKVMYDIQHAKMVWGDLWPFLVLFVGYVICSFGIIWWFQRKNEKAWDGR